MSQRDWQRVYQVQGRVEGISYPESSSNTKKKKSNMIAYDESYGDSDRKTCLLYEGFSLGEIVCLKKLYLTKVTKKLTTIEMDFGF